MADVPVGPFVVLIGESRLVDDLANLCVGAGLQPRVYSTLDSSNSNARQKIADDARSARVVIDGICRSLDAKRDLVRLLNAALPAESLLLTACFIASATQVAAWVNHPERVVGFGCLPPLGQGSPVELALPLQAQVAELDQAHEFFGRIGMQTAVVRDGVGLVLPRIVCCLVNEAAYALMERAAEASDIDTAMKLGANYPRGPLEWGDLIGLDVVLSVLHSLHKESGDDHYRPAPLIRQLVRAGWVGIKTGRGFYSYTA